MPGLSLALLGSFQAEFNGRPLTHFRAKTVQALLVYLTCQPEAHSREHLMTLLWPGMPQSSALSNLRQTLYLLRQAIPEIEAWNGGKRLVWLASPDGKIKMWNSGEYKEIVPHQRLV
jgi:DNA-binding SARP family transcriptional activator